MSPAGFVELCARTSFSGITIEGFGAVEGRSLLDAEAAWPGAGMPDEIVGRAAVLEQDVVAVADLDTVAGVVRAHAAGVEQGVRVIPGCELLLDEGSLVLLPQDAQGWAHLCEILTLARDGTLQRGLEKDDVEHHLDWILQRARGLFAIAWPPFGRAGLRLLREAFADRLSLGVCFHAVPEDGLRLAWASELSQELDTPLVLSNRPLLVDAADRPIHDVLTCIRQHLSLATAGQRLLPNAEARMRSEAETVAIARSRMRDLGRDRGVDRAIAEWLARSRGIADACSFQLSALRYSFPVDHPDPDALLQQRTLAGAHRRYGGAVPSEVDAQLRHELDLIRDLDVAPYFLTVNDIVDIARDKGILCQGRGSAANSAVCYCLGITSIDPVRMGLLFERFLSRERNEPPDIDVDFEHERREEVIQAIYERWGRNHAALVAEVISYRGRSAVREVGKVHGLSESVTGRIAELMLHSSFSEWRSHGSSRAPPDFARVVREAGLDRKDRRIRQTLELALRLQGHPRHLGIHVGGFVLTRAPLTTLAPIEPARMPGRSVLPWDKDDVDALGLFKMDVLGLGMLTCIRKALALVNDSSSNGFDVSASRVLLANEQETNANDPGGGNQSFSPPTHPPPHGAGPINAGFGWTVNQRDDALINNLSNRSENQRQDLLELHTIPAEDPRVYDTLCRGDSIGVFQVESRAQMAMLPRLRPRCFYDLVVEVAIIRPGPIQGGMVHPYLRRRNGEEHVEYPHESLRGILERTLGVPLFQEQVMKLAIVGANYTPGEADQLRRDMAAWRRNGKLQRHRDRLIAGFSQKGIARDFAERLYEQIQGFGEYGFPESHAASFAILVYASAWLKTHHPAAFACALLNSLPMGFYAPAQIVADAQRHGVVVLPVDVNASDWDCTLIDGALRLGLRLVKGLRQGVGEGIALARQQRPFRDVQDVVQRAALDKKMRLALARAGALDSLASHRRAALWGARHVPPPLLASAMEPQPELSAPSAAEVMVLDYASTGLSLDDHPMCHVRPGLLRTLAAEASRLPLLDSRGVAEARHGTRAWVTGLVIGRQRPGTADGTCFITLEDEHGMVNVVVWGRDFDAWRTTIVTSRFLLVDANIERQGIVVHAIARGVAAVAPAPGTFSKGRDGERAQLAFPFEARSFR